VPPFPEGSLSVLETLPGIGVSGPVVSENQDRNREAERGDFGGAGLPAQRRLVRSRKVRAGGSPGREAPAPTHRPLRVFAGDTTHTSSVARKGARTVPQQI